MKTSPARGKQVRLLAVQLVTDRGGKTGPEASMRLRGCAGGHLSISKGELGTAARLQTCWILLAPTAESGWLWGQCEVDERLSLLIYS